MFRKLSAILTATAVTAIALAGCAASQTSMLDYLRGSWTCTGSDREGVFMPRAFTAEITDEALSLHSEDENTVAIFETVGAPFDISERDGMVTFDSIAVQFPDKPEDGATISIPYGAIKDGGVNTETEWLMTTNGSDATLTLNSIKDGSLYSDAGTCTKQ